MVDGVQSIGFFIITILHRSIISANGEEAYCLKHTAAKHRPLQSSSFVKVCHQGQERFEFAVFSESAPANANFRQSGG